jgi:GDP/UDP-N,N'-diacetylbacillosamine 2-epimerase (hydrolysing)
VSRKVCVVTGTRAEFGLLRYLMQDIIDTENIDLQVIATGTHVSNEHGLTILEIEQAGIKVDYTVEMLLSADTPVAITKSMGIGLIGFADAFSALKPDLVLVLGDRFELFSAVSSALIAKIPVAHLHGGETTEGAFDEAIRHSITKMSHLHFVANAAYQRRVIQLGEDPERVVLVGGLGVDAIKRTTLLCREDLEASLGFKLGANNLLITFHPVTLDRESSTTQMTHLLNALDQLKDTHLIFTLPNADTGGRELAEMLEVFATNRSHVRVFESLGHLRYLSCLQFVDGVIGNSSSGLAEAPSMGIGTVNIGDRQKGRLSANSVIHCSPTYEHILEALLYLKSDQFQTSLSSITNPYGDGGACQKIVDVIKKHPLERLLKKTFYDVQFRI